MRNESQNTILTGYYSGTDQPVCIFGDCDWLFLFAARLVLTVEGCVLN